jgi:hypothetical protein
VVSLILVNPRDGAAPDAEQSGVNGQRKAPLPVAQLRWADGRAILDEELVPLRSVELWSLPRD